eukprot:COSAG05_NODE_216_length_13897_cov_30.273011_3_plen_569_part_00
MNSFWVKVRDGNNNIKDPIAFSTTPMERDTVVAILHVDAGNRTASRHEASLPITKWEPRKSAYIVSFIGRLAGIYNVQVQLSSGKIAGIIPASPFQLTVLPGPFDENQTLVTVEPSGLKLAAGKTLVVNVTARDQYGNTRVNNDSLSATTTPVRSVNLSWTDAGPTYLIHFVATESSEYSIAAVLGGRAMKASPLQITVDQAAVDLTTSEIKGCIKSCLTMPNQMNSVAVIVRDMYRNERLNRDSVRLHGSTASLKQSTKWAAVENRYNASFSLTSYDETDFDVSVTINSRPLSVMDYHVIFWTNLNGSFCAHMQCDKVLDSHQRFDESFASQLEPCAGAGCNYAAAEWQTLNVTISATAMARFKGHIIHPRLNAEKQQCSDWQTKTSATKYYWLTKPYCDQSISRFRIKHKPIILDNAPSNLAPTVVQLQFKVTKPGKYEFTASVAVSGNIWNDHSWKRTVANIDVSPGQVDPTKSILKMKRHESQLRECNGTTVPCQRSSRNAVVDTARAMLTPVAGNGQTAKFAFTIQLKDHGGNDLWGTGKPPKAVVARVLLYCCSIVFQSAVN